MNSRIIGAGRHSDGGHALIFPSSASNIPVEMFEVATPMLVREKDTVLDDVRNGLVSVASAATDYGVIIDPVTMAVDEDATQAQRADRA